MNQKHVIILGLVSVIILIGIAGYFMLSVNTPPATPEVSTASSTPATELASTTTTTTVTTVTTPPETPATTEVNMVTQADDNTTVVLKHGQRFGIAMGDSLQWELSFDPTGIVTRVTNISTIRGEQGVYTASTVGTTTLHATGRPICNPDEMCAQFIKEITVTLVVK
ncbi:MAG: hypothetical protein JWN64_731 [Parcubacteria group bacterium]|nr:hypothetical protein [Parcubacteria group bacterium]